MADDDSSELSSISSLSAPPSGDESDIQLERKAGILKFFHKVDRNPELDYKEPSPPRPKRDPSPPHEYVLADNPDIAFIVMFRSRFSDVFPKSLAHFGPQELEGDVVDAIPGERLELFLCALLGLLLNRKQDVKPGHYNRALEEAIHTHKSQWAMEWQGQNPLAGGATFSSMTPVRRLALLRTLIQWSLSSSDAVKTMINQHYKSRTDDDLNIPLSVQSWGSDGDKRRYFLIEGRDDTAFRVYRESNPAGLQRTWWSVAGSIDELKALAEKLESTDGGPRAKALAKRITNSIPRFEATEDKRRRREYRLMRKDQFKRPDNGMSLYEGRTRGKRMKYTYSDDEGSDSTNRRSTRNTGNHSPAEPAGPVVTARGRQIRAPVRLNAESVTNGLQSAAPSVQGDADVGMVEPSVGPTGRPRRSAAVHHGMNGWASKKRKTAAYDSEDDDDGSEPDFGDNEEEHVPDETEDDDEDEFDEPELDDEDDEMADHSKKIRMFTFPIKVIIDKDGRVKLVPKATSPSDKHKHSTAADGHVEKIILSEESETTSCGEQRQYPVAEETAAEEVIAVAAPRPITQTATHTTASPTAVVHPPLTPPVAPTTCLAFRESPEIQRSEPVLQPIDVGVE